MSNGVYYNEIDKKAACWLRELMREGLIPSGEVDERSIEDVKASEVKGFLQCHFFAGIGGWSEALRLAGWGRGRVWTGSPPCQPFSVAGKRKGTKDKRHLWPAFYGLIRECSPPVVLGEQVSSAIKLGWIDRVQADMEKEGYACGYHVLGAHCVGSPHIRQRLYWGAYRRAEDSERQDDRAEVDGHEVSRKEAVGPASWARGPSEPGGVADHERGGRGSSRVAGGVDGIPGQEQDVPVPPEERGSHGGVGDPEGYDERGDAVPGKDRKGEPLGGPGGDDGFWKSIYYACLDGKIRRIPASVSLEPIFQRMVNGLPSGLDGLRPESGFPLCSNVESRISLLKGYGNAIVPQLAAQFVMAFEESVREATK